MTRAHPYDVVCATLLATLLLPIGAAGRSAVWIGTFIVAVLAMRRKWQAHATELSRATMLPSDPQRPDREIGGQRRGRSD